MMLDICFSFNLLRTWCTRSAIVEYARGRNVLSGSCPLPRKTFSFNNSFTKGKNALRKSVARICLVATNSSFRTVVALLGQALNKYTTASAICLLCGFMDLANDLRRYVKNDRVFIWHPTISSNLDLYFECDVCVVNGGIFCCIAAIIFGIKSPIFSRVCVGWS